LLEVARARAAEEGLTAAFTEGDAVALPVADASFDAALSVFGVIFAEPAPAAAELLRVVRPGGRIIFTTWVPGGPTNRVIELMREALGGPPQPPRWSSEEFVRDLFAPHEVRTERHALSFTAPSADEFVREQAEQHPMWLAALPRLDELGRRAEVLDAVTAVMAETNEDPGAFRTTSEYDVVTVLRG
jgi:ubiquinone/menaquinone biosynthesis C-methylase UbiE